MTAVLLIDDDIDFAVSLKTYLQQSGFEVDAAHDDGVSRALSGEYALAIVNATLQGSNGIEALRRIRQRDSIPILMLTSDDTDRIVCLELGADDCAPKLCAPRELLARMRAILRRTRSSDSGIPSNKVVTVGALTMWPEQRRAEWRGKPLELTSTEFSLLEILARNAGRTISKNDLSEQALGRPLERYDRNIDVHLSSIRQKLGPLLDERPFIQTVFRKGYQLIKE